MEAILAAAELIFDSAFDVFSKGWHERGRLLLADSKRAETLNSVAKQLRNLSSEPSDSGLALGFPNHGNRRRLMASAGRKGEGVGVANESLAEWEVIAVDRQTFQDRTFRIPRSKDRNFVGLFIPDRRGNAVKGFELNVVSAR